MACHPNFPILLIIKLLEPIESPRTKSNRNMVREILFSTFCKNRKSRNRYPMPIPVNIIDIIAVSYTHLTLPTTPYV